MVPTVRIIASAPGGEETTNCLRTAGAVAEKHPSTPQPLPSTTAGAPHLERHDERSVLAESQVRLQADFDQRRPHLGQAGRLAEGKRLVRELGQARPAPKGQ